MGRDMKRCTASVWGEVSNMHCNSPIQGLLPRIGSRAVYLLRQMTRVGGTEGSGAVLFVLVVLWEELDATLLEFEAAVASCAASEGLLGFFFVIVRMMKLEVGAMAQKTSRNICDRE
jgi:hypothetical protein